MFFDEMEKDEIDAFLDTAFDKKDDYNGEYTPEEARRIRTEHFIKLKEEREAIEKEQVENYQINFNKIQREVTDAEMGAQAEISEDELKQLSLRRTKVEKYLNDLDNSEENYQQVSSLLKELNELDKQIEDKLAAGFHAYRDAGPEVEVTNVEYYMTENEYENFNGSIKESFIHKFEQEDMPEEFQQIVDDNFEDLIK